MTAPATSGVLRTNIADMQIGDYIACGYQASSGVVGTFSELGTCIAEEISVTTSITPNGLFYLLKCDKGLLISDRVVQCYISWNTLNAGKYIQGKPTLLGATSGIIRSLTGGVAYADANGNKSTTEQDYGAWPINNEWDTYIVNSDFDGKITPGDDNVWHWSALLSLTQDTPITLIMPSDYRVVRGKSNLLFFSAVISSSTSTVRGFRPCFEYQE